MHVENYLERMEPKREGNNLWISVDRKNLPRILKDLKSLGVSRISSISGVDVRDKIEVIYHLIHKNMTINVRVQIDKKDCVIDTVTDTYPGANLFERELHEMLGVEIKNHPNLKRLFLSDDSPQNPLRKS